jgi:hypothetical protein
MFNENLISTSGIVKKILERSSIVNKISEKFNKFVETFIEGI